MTTIDLTKNMTYAEQLAYHLGRFFNLFTFKVAAVTGTVSGSGFVLSWATDQTAGLTLWLCLATIISAVKVFEKFLPQGVSTGPTGYSQSESDRYFWQSMDDMDERNQEDMHYDDGFQTIDPIMDFEFMGSPGNINNGTAFDD